MAKASPGASSPVDDHVLGMLDELEQQKTENIRLQRTHQRLDIKATVILQPGNTSDLQNLKARGTTADVSRGGCRIVFPVPMCVGDIYRLTFEDDSLGFPLIFARCLRCRLVREGAFEAGFRFFNDVELPDSGSRGQTADLLG